MKRFIKTKSGKIGDLDTMTFDSALPKENYIKFNAVKQADTIDELLDQVVYVKDKSFEVYLHLSEKKYDLEQMKKGCTIYGAVGTDKGLIYVAKLNKKGEWELL